MTPTLQETELTGHRNGTADRRQKNEAARQLLKQWLADTSGYDEAAWPQAKAIIEENSLSARKRFDD